MNCPDCNHDTTSIVDTRRTEAGETVRRRRECNQCQFRYTTYERKDWDQLRVKKSDETTELFDAQKIRRGIELAVEKRPITAEQIEAITDEITAEKKAQDDVLDEILADDVLSSSGTDAEATRGSEAGTHSDQ